MQKSSAMILQAVFLVSIILPPSVSGACEDIDHAICAALLTQKSDMCNSNCFISLCHRTCGKCPPQCFSCHEISDPRQCNNIVECPSHDHWCAVTESLNDQFDKVYKLGCSSVQHCVEYFETNIPLIGRRKRGGGVLQGECCPRDKCNNNLPANLDTSGGSIDSNVVTTAASVIATSAPCRDIEPTICAALANKYLPRDMCDNTCIAQELCPKSCGNCLECYDCSRVQSTQDCSQIRNCSFGEKCYTLQTMVAGQNGYRVGCMTADICSRFSTLPSSGRRHLGESRVSLSGGCCSFDRCNNQPLHARARSKAANKPAPIPWG